MIEDGKDMKAFDFLQKNKKEVVISYIISLIKSDHYYSKEGSSDEEMAEYAYKIIKDYLCFNESNPLSTKYGEKAFFIPNSKMLLRDGRLDADIKYAMHFITNSFLNSKGEYKRKIDFGKIRNIDFLSTCITSPDDRLISNNDESKVYYYKKTINNHGLVNFDVVLDSDFHIMYVTIMPNKSKSWLENKKKNAEYNSASPFKIPLDNPSGELSTHFDSESQTLNQNPSANISNNNDMDKLAEGGTVQERVDAKLLEQQKNKEFKDIGRVQQTRKEKSAYKLISSEVLSDLELDPVMAYNMVKKDSVWPEIDVRAEKEKGVSSGAAFLKVKIRECVPTRPKDEKNARSAYVLFLTKLQNDLSTCLTISDIESLVASYRAMSTETVIGTIIEPSYFSASEEQKKEIKEKLKANSSLRMAMLYGSGTLMLKLIKEIFGARFQNILFKYSDAALIIWNEAKQKASISEEESKEFVDTLLRRKENFIKANEEKIAEYKNKTPLELKVSMDRDWQINGGLKKLYKLEIEKFREFAISYYERRIRNEQAVFDKKLIAVGQREEDWSWFEAPKKSEKTESKPKSESINTKEPLAYIKRTGGFKIDTYSAQEVVEKFGFSAVNYGVYVDDSWSKEHTKHFLGAMCDLAEIMNFDIKQFNQLGKLAIAFGAKGRKGHAAAYFPQTKDINLTKGNGDGSVAHEWGHYFDNVIVELDKKLATNRFATEGAMDDYEIKILFAEMMGFFYKGNPLYTPKVPMNFFAKAQDTPPSFSRRINGEWKSFQVEIKPTIEETLAQLDQYAIVNKDYYSTQLRLFGYVIHAFGLESYLVPMTLKTSYVFHKSAYSAFRYCYMNEKGVMEIGVHQRTKYWSSAVELFARAWETVVLKKLIDKGRFSNYLVDGISLEDVVSETYFRPYPAGKELDYLENIIDRIMVAVKKKFNIGDFIPPNANKEDEYLDLAPNGNVEAGMVIDEKTGEVDFVGAIATLEMLIEGGADEVTLAEWKEAVETMKLISQ
jgi:hypothetical protein